MTALELEEIQPDISIAELERRWGISRNALKARANALGIKLQRKGPTLTVWPGDRIADGDRLDEHCKAGGALASFPGAVGRHLAVTPHDGSDTQLAVTPQDVTDSSQLAVLAAAIAGAMPSPPADPLRRAKALADAADLGVALSTAEMADVLGMAVGTVRGLPDGHCPRPGFTLRRQKAGNAVWWFVERPGSSGTVRAIAGAAGGRSVGFIAEPVVNRQTINVSAVALPAF